MSTGGYGTPPLLGEWGRRLLNIIVAVDKNWGIGKDGNLLFRIPEDMRHFRRLTTDKAVVMGRKTFESLPGGKPLKNRVNIVLSSNAFYDVEGVVLCRSLAELKEELKKYASEDVFVIGGQKVFEELLPYCAFAYVTEYDRAFEADRRFPDIVHTGAWRPVQTLLQGTHEEHGYSIILYENKLSKAL